MNILAISGSMRKKSYNTALLRAASSLCPPHVNFSIYESLRDLPPFDPDLEEDAISAPVLDLRQQVAGAEALVFSTPEYAHGIPGAFKNALDWLVPSSEIVLKSIAVMSVSTSELGGFRAQSDLIRILHAMNTNIIIDACLAVPFATRKFDDNGVLIDHQSVEALKLAMTRVYDIVNRRMQQ